MRGTYSFYEDGELVGEHPNLVTTVGKTAILKYLAKISPDYGGAIAVGLDGTAANIADVRLGIETARVPVIMKSVDYGNKYVIFKGTLDAAWSGKIYETGLIDQLSGSPTGVYSSRILSTFQPYEIWTPTTDDASPSYTDTYSYGASRIGTAYQFHKFSQNSKFITIENFKPLDLSGYSDTDQISWGHISFTNRLTSLTPRFTDAAGNYAEYVQTVTTHAAGDNVPQYNIYRVNKSSFSLSSASFDWARIIKLSVKVIGSASAGSTPFGQGAWEFVGVIDTDLLNPDYTLISRAAAGTSANVTFQITPDTVTLTSHGFQNGDYISFPTVVTTTGITANTPYYVISATTNTFQVSLTLGGSAINLATGDGTGTIVPAPLARKTAGKVMDIEYKLEFNL